MWNNGKKIDAIIFDFDGVIINSEPFHWQASNIVFEKMGFRISYEHYLKNYVGVADKEMFPKILIENGFNPQDHDVQHFIQQKIIAFKNVIHSSAELRSINGLPQFLQMMHQIIPNIGICTGAALIEIESALAKIESGSLKNYFKAITTSDEVTKGKPSPEGYLKTAEKLNVNPENCLVIEDTRIGIQAAKAANMHVIGIATTHDKEMLTQANLVINDYSDIDLEQLVLEI